MRVAFYAITILCGLGSAAAAQQQAPAAAPVGVITAQRKPIAKMLDLVGRVEAIERVEIRARITGYLELINFREGDLVRQGAPLYAIEKGLFEADVQRAQGALERSKASKLLSRVQLQRAEELLARNAGTQAILTDEANLQTAKINLKATDITSPITGKISRTAVTKGNVVTPQTPPLTTIVSQDPMYVAFPVSQREFLRAQKGVKASDLKSIKTQLRFGDDFL